jgi:hypothetical protein
MNFLRMRVDLKTVRLLSWQLRAKNSQLSLKRTRKIESLMKRSRRSEMRRRGSLIINERLKKRRSKLPLMRLRRKKRKSRRERRQRPK